MGTWDRYLGMEGRSWGCTKQGTGCPQPRCWCLPAVEHRLRDAAFVTPQRRLLRPSCWSRSGTWSCRGFLLLNLEM